MANKKGIWKLHVSNSEDNDEIELTKDDIKSVIYELQNGNMEGKIEKDEE
ncbi:MAG: hypothetical protein PHW62_00285 [Candidatus Ratteibacteria bacterium]|nr:hypothetical protein [Candidatus Ratteibacteria bacterium]